MVLGPAILLIVALLLLLLLGSIATARVLIRPPRRTAGNAIAHGHPTDPAEAEATYTSHTLASNGRGELPIDLWIVEGDRPDGPALILLHGWGDSRLGSLLWLDVLRPVASRLILFDLRAHGESCYRRFTWGDREIADIQRVVTYTEQPRPRRPIALAGWSAGAALAISAACRLGTDRVAAVLADSLFRFARTAITNTLRAQRLPSRPLTTGALWILRLRGLRAIHTDLAATAAQLQQPLLILHGARDEIAPIADARVIAQAAPHATLEVFDDTDHLAAACADPRRYTQIVSDWLIGTPGDPDTTRVDSQSGARR